MTITYVPSTLDAIPISKFKSGDCGVAVFVANSEFRGEPFILVEDRICWLGDHLGRTSQATHTNITARRADFELKELS